MLLFILISLFLYHCPKNEGFFRKYEQMFSTDLFIFMKDAAKCWKGLEPRRTLVGIGLKKCFTRYWLLTMFQVTLRYQAHCNICDFSKKCVLFETSIGIIESFRFHFAII